MANTKTFKIEINGISENISAVNSLIKQLDVLEARIKEINSLGVNLKTATKSSNTSALNEEEKLAKQIQQIDAKREAYSKEIYQNYLAAKDVLSETVKDQKQIAASERLSAKSYSNTMAGMKQELADIKAVMQTVDLGDNDTFQKMTQRANELNEKLKEIEATYGQFGRNVGNYSQAFEGINKLVIKVGETEREFNNAREASRTLKNELINLEAAGKGSTTQADNLRKAINQLKSTMDDATVSSKAMDTAMDWMQSFTAIATMNQSFKTLFGFDDTEVTKSIQQLVALQGALNGIENIRKQMDSREGVGQILGKGFEKIDQYTHKMLVFNRALQGTGTSAKIAAVGIKALGVAMKYLTSLGIYAVINLATDAIMKLVGGLRDWAKGNADLVKSEDMVNVAFDRVNTTLEQRLKLNNQLKDSNKLSDIKKQIEDELAYADAIAKANEELKKRMNYNPANATFANYASGKKGTSDIFEDDGVTTFGGFSEAIKDAEELKKRYNALSEAVEKNTGLVYKNAKGFEIAHLSASDAKDEFNHLEQILGGTLVRSMMAFDMKTKEGRKGLQDFVNEIMKSDDVMYKSTLLRLPEIVNNEKGNLSTALKGWLDIIKQFVANAELAMTPMKFEEYVNNILDSADESGKRLADKQKKELTERYQALSKEEQKQEEKLYKQGLAAIDKMQKKKNQKLVKDQDTIDKELHELRIKNMKEGLDKELAQIKEEWRQKLKLAKGNNALREEINKYYNKRIEDATRDHAAEMASIYREMWNDIYRISDQSIRMNLDSELTQLETSIDKAQERLTKIFDSRNASYGGTRFNTNVSDKLKSQLGYWIYSKEQEATGESRIGGNFNEGIERAQQYQEVLEKAEAAQMRYDKALKTGSEAQQKYTKETLDNAEKELNAWIKKYKSEEQTVEEFKDFMEDNWATEIVRENNYTKSIFAQYTRRINEAQDYYKKLGETQILHSEMILKNEVELLKNEENAEKRSEVDRYNDQMARLQENLRNGLLTQENYNELVERAYEEHAVALEAIAKRAATEQERLTQEDINRKKQIVSDGLRGMLNEYRDAYSAISKIQTRQPQTDSEGWGVVNIKATRRNYKEALEAYKALSNDILDEKNKLQKRLDDNEISFDDFQQAKRELDGLAQDTADAAQEVTENLKNVEGEFIQSIQQYIQALGQGLQTIMSAVWDAQDTEFDNEARQLDKLNDALQKAMDKNEEILERHKNNVDSIEDELQTARGSRREHLIDQLNAEILAERKAAAEKKKLEKEQEALEKKQEELDKKRQMAQYQRELANILVSGALAAVNAYATKPFVPVGLAMGSLSLALTAAQYAIAKANPPKFANGGLLEGKSHAQGGIKAGGVELEGHEYVINKHTTMQNIDLLEYINSNRRKLNISDLIGFYQGDRPRKSVQGVKTRFADGGQIPTLRTDIEVNRELADAFREYSNRPVWVSVKDINSKQAAVRNVQVLAGLSE